MILHNNVARNRWGPVLRPAGLRARGRWGARGSSRDLLRGSRRLSGASRELWEGPVGRSVGRLIGLIRVI